MAQNLTELVEQIANALAEIYQIQQLAVSVLQQHEESIGGNPNKQNFERISNLMQTSWANSGIQQGISALQSLADTPFDQPPAQPPAP